MNKQFFPAVCLVSPSGQQVIHAFGDEITVLLSALETGGQFSMFTDLTPPGGGPPPHYHLNEDEWFYVLEGRAEFLKDDTWIELLAGSAVYVPRGVVHAFRNPGDEPLRMLIHASPSGIENFFASCAVEFNKPGPTDFNRIIEISADHGIHFVNP